MKTFAQIAPNWAKGIRERLEKSQYLPKLIVGFKDKKRHRLFDHACCIVGEAHDFDDSYSIFGSEDYCAICDDIAGDFYDECAVPIWTIEDPRARFAELRAKFVNHWNNKHLVRNKK